MHLVTTFHLSRLAKTKIASEYSFVAILGPNGVAALEESTFDTTFFVSITCQAKEVVTIPFQVQGSFAFENSH